MQTQSRLDHHSPYVKLKINSIWTCGKTHSNSKLLIMPAQHFEMGVSYKAIGIFYVFWYAWIDPHPKTILMKNAFSTFN